MLNSQDFLNLKNIASLSKEEAINLFGKDNLQEGFFICKTCGKRTPLSEMGVVSSQVLDKILDPICDECRNEFNKMKVCLIACIGCKEIIARMEPKKYKNGFETKAGHVYHIADCPSCNPDKFKDPSKPIPSSIIEEKLFNNKLK